ncbi:hypothetical protein BGZ94_004085 [Podila epigama]|nr:hypothetical protein BGZ94_004085 [Podila epigama]
MVSLPIENHKVLFKNYPNSFTSEEAIANLGGLQFIQSNRDTDPKDPTRIITHVVTTQFSLSRDMAKNLCQTFMDARLFENAADPNRREFQNKGIYQVTPKGAHILAKFVHRNSLPVDETRHITANSSANLVYLERADDEDAIILTQKQIDNVFKRFAGSEPNVARAAGAPSDSPPIANPGGSGRDRTPSTIDLCKGIEVKDQQHNYDVYKHTFYGKAAVEWLLDYTTVISKEEAICIAQEMVNGGYIEQVGEDSHVSQALFKTGNSALYHLTQLGRSIAGWKTLALNSGSSVDNDWMDERGNVTKGERPVNDALILSQQFKLTSGTVQRLPISITRDMSRSVEDTSNGSAPFSDDSSRGMRRLSQILNDPAFQITLSEAASMSSYAPSSAGCESVGVSSSVGHSSVSSSSQSTTSNTTRLNIILSNATLRDLFKSFLKQNICEENLSFYLEVVDFKSKFNTLINSTRAYAQSVTGQEQAGLGQIHPPSLRELEKQICIQAFAIFETYLALGSPREVNLPHQMRADITSYMQAVIKNMESMDEKSSLSSSPSSPDASATEGSDAEGSGGGGKELIRISLFDDIHDHIFRLMSTDSVPKFTKTDKYREVMMNRVKQGQGSSSPNIRATPGGGDTKGGETGGDPSLTTSGSNGSTGVGSGGGGTRAPNVGSSRNEGESRIAEQRR